jgi:Fe-S-cluster-containing dehydrogenase component
MFKEENYGAVLIDPSKETQPVLRTAAAACPYGAIVFESDAPDAKAFKCTMCVDRLASGRQPACVMACPQRALDFGRIVDLRAKYGSNSQLEGMPSPDLTKPAVVFKPQKPKTKLVPYDEAKALQLMMTRPGDLPKVFDDPSEETVVPDGLVGRRRLVMKASGARELLRLTQNDES